VWGWQAAYLDQLGRRCRRRQSLAEEARDSPGIGQLTGRYPNPRGTNTGTGHVMTGSACKKTRKSASFSLLIVVVHLLLPTGRNFGRTTEKRPNENVRTDIEKNVDFCCQVSERLVKKRTTVQ
jgi:hypothetical protein